MGCLRRTCAVYECPQIADYECEVTLQMNGRTDGQTEQQMKGWSDLCALYINWKYSACNGEHLHTNTYSSSLLITSLYRQNAAPLFLYVYIYLVVPYFVDEASIRKVTSKPGTNGERDGRTNLFLIVCFCLLYILCACSDLIA